MSGRSWESIWILNPRPPNEPVGGPIGSRASPAVGCSFYVLSVAVAFLPFTAKQRGDAAVQCDGFGEPMRPETTKRLSRRFGRVHASHEAGAYCANCRTSVPLNPGIRCRAGVRRDGRNCPMLGQGHNLDRPGHLRARASGRLDLVCGLMGLAQAPCRIASALAGSQQARCLAISRWVSDEPPTVP